ncbi:MAG: hypothetical protein M1820_005254 [Bogoriella megaspora]|nr:MAG: hypothetical protein M1820_005254 [Bogoriella megaspora]
MSSQATTFPSLPETHRALLVKSTDSPLTLTTLPLPVAPHGSALIRVLANQVISYARAVYSSTGRAYPFPLPLIAGASGIGRIATLPPDASTLQIGQLVFVDCTTRARDNPGAIYLAGVHSGHTDGSRKLMDDDSLGLGGWRDGCVSQFTIAPLENLTLLDEKRLCGAPSDGGLWYSVERLAFLSTLLVPYGGLRDVGLTAGETVVIAPATAGFSGAAVMVALAMGARVLAMGRDEEKLARLEKVFGREKVRAVKITNDADEDAKTLREVWGETDVFFDISPRQAIQSTHFKSGILSLKHRGRVSMMGGQRGDVAIPMEYVMHRDISLKGKWMYERDAVIGLVKMIESGVLGLKAEDGVDVIGVFGLEEWDNAFTVAAESNWPGSVTVIKP